MGLDEYGFPATMVANALLVEQEQFGDSEKDLEKAWLEWLHYYPFDAVVAGRLASLMEERLSRLDEKNNGAQRQLLERKLKFVAQKIERYRMEDFVR